MTIARLKRKLMIKKKSYDIKTNTKMSDSKKFLNHHANKQSLAFLNTETFASLEYEYILDGISPMLPTVLGIVAIIS